MKWQVSHMGVRTQEMPYKKRDSSFVKRKMPNMGILHKYLKGEVALSMKKVKEPSPQTSALRRTVSKLATSGAKGRGD